VKSRIEELISDHKPPAEWALIWQSGEERTAPSAAAAARASGER
jgi:hypothetical protein